MPYLVTDDYIADRNASSPFAEAGSDFCAKWLDANCNPDDLEFIKAVRPSFWGAGVGYSETEHLARRLSRPPSRAEVEREIARTSRIMGPCFEAMTQTREYLDAKREHDAPKNSSE